MCFITEKDFKNLADVKKFDYLLGMPMWMLTDERKNELLRQKGDKLTELETLKRKTIQTLWRDDIDAFLEKLAVIEEKERKDDEAGGVKEVAKKGVSKVSNFPYWNHLRSKMYLFYLRAKRKCCTK